MERQVGTYGNNDSSSFSYTVDEGATAMLTITGSTEANWDYIYVYDGAGSELAALTGSYGTQQVVSNDATITVTFASDGSVSGYESSWTVGCVDDNAVSGCMNSNADNYVADATMDDGSCEFSCPFTSAGVMYPEETCDLYVNSYGYTVDEMLTYFGYDCSCMPVPVMGCMDASADNYNADATDYDGSCVFTVAVGDEGVSGSYDYVNNDASSWTFTGAEGNLLTMTLGGSTEAGWDYLIVNGISYNGSLEGIVVESTDNVITMSMDSDGSYTDGPITWSVVSALPATCDDDSACNFGEIGNCSFPEDGFDCNGNCLSGVAATLTANDQYSDSWNGAVMNVTIDGVLFDPFGLGFTYTLASGLATESTTVCLPDGVIAGTSCVQIEVTEGNYPGEISWALDVYGSTIAAGGAPFFGELGCAISGCMDETACNYNSEATVSDDASCTYPEVNADCEGNFVCNDLLFTLDMYDLSGDADGWNGNTFQVIDWVTGEVVPGAGPFTFDEGEMGTALACFPEDMATGCYVMEIGGGENEAQVGWHLYGFEVFGSYVVDWSAGMAQEWSGVGGELLFGDSQTYQDENGDFIDCTEEDGLCEGYGDWLSGVGTYDTNNDGAADGYDIGYGCPCLNQDAVNYVFTSSEDPYGEVIPVDAQDQSDPCEYGDPVVPGCTDMYATNYNPEANEDDGSCVLPDCVGTGADQDATVAALVAGASQAILGSAIMVNGCYDGLQVLASLGVTCDSDMSVYTDALAPGTTAQMLCGCSCPDPVETTCMDEMACNYEEVGDCEFAADGYDCAGDPLTCAGSGTNMNDLIAAGFGAYGVTNCEGVIGFLMATYGYTYEEACAWDGTGFADGVFGELGTLGGACGCSCADPVVSFCDTGASDEYTYGNSDSTAFSYTGDEGSTVSVTLTGSTEANWDFIDIYNGVLY